MGRTLGNTALHLSKGRITSCLVILLMTPCSMVFGQDPTPGKYSCSIANIVGLQTNSETGSRCSSGASSQRCSAGGDRGGPTSEAIMLDFVNSAQERGAIK